MTAEEFHTDIFVWLLNAFLSDFLKKWTDFSSVHFFVPKFKKLSGKFLYLKLIMV